MKYIDTIKFLITHFIPHSVA